MSMLSHVKGLTEKEMDYMRNFKPKSNLSIASSKSIRVSETITNACKLNPGIYINIAASDDLKLGPIITGAVCETPPPQQLY